MNRVIFHSITLLGYASGSRTLNFSENFQVRFYDSFRLLEILAVLVHAIKKNNKIVHAQIITIS